MGTMNQGSGKRDGKNRSLRDGKERVFAPDVVLGVRWNEMTVETIDREDSPTAHLSDFTNHLVFANSSRNDRVRQEGDLWRSNRFSLLSCPDDVNTCGLIGQPRAFSLPHLVRANDLCPVKKIYFPSNSQVSTSKFLPPWDLSCQLAL